MSKYQARNQNNLSDEDEHEDESKNIHKNLKFGQFYVYQKQSDDTKMKVLINPLSQDELANGWSLVLPGVSKNTRIHHFKIFLSHLPEHLWNKLHINNDDPEYYDVISDKIYRYSVQRSANDNYIKELYNCIMNCNFNSFKVRELYDYLKNNNVKGWLMIRTRHLLHDTCLF